MRSFEIYVKSANLQQTAGDTTKEMGYAILTDTCDETRFVKKDISRLFSLADIILNQLIIQFVHYILEFILIIACVYRSYITQYNSLVLITE